MALEFLKFWDKQEKDEQKQADRSPVKSFAAPDNIDGATDVEQNMLGPMMAGVANANGEDSRPKIRELVRQYRGLASYHEVDDAIQEIVDEAIVVEDGKEVVWLDMDSTDFSENIKKRIEDEFSKVVQMLKIRKHGHKWFRRWYVDGRIYFHKILDKNNNIVELRPLDPTKLELVREIQKEERDGVSIVVNTVEYYLYKSSVGGGTWAQHHQSEVRIPKEAIVFAHSGQYDSCTESSFIIGYLHRAIKPANQLKMLEDALVIYRLSRAPERRVFYVDVGNLPTNKAQQYVNGIINSVKNRLVYDTNTGKVKNSTNAMSMLEDYYLPRREGGKGTEVTTLPSGQNLGEIEDVQYFNRKLFKAMYIPSSRASAEDSQMGISFGGGGEITRDELKFSKFVRRLQTRFETILMDPLKHQLIVNNIITEQEWDDNVERMYCTFNKDSYFEEAKDLEILNSRMNALREIREHVGVYFSNAYVQKNILRLSDDQIETIRKEIEEEQDKPQFQRDDGF